VLSFRLPLMQICIRGILLLWNNYLLKNDKKILTIKINSAILGINYDRIMWKNKMERIEFMNQEKLIRFTSVLLEFMFYSGILVIVTLPFSLRLLSQYSFVWIGEYYVLLLVVFMPAGVFGILIIRNLVKMMRTVKEKNCFVIQNVASLKRMGIYSFIISFLFLMIILFRPTPATVMVILTFFIAGLFCFVLAFVFKEAIQYKEENELMI